MAAWSMASLIVAAIFLLRLTSASVAHGRRSSNRRRFVSSYDEPCMEMRLYLHDIRDKTSPPKDRPTRQPIGCGKNHEYSEGLLLLTERQTMGCKSARGETEKEGDVDRSTSEHAGSKTSETLWCERIALIFNYSDADGVYVRS
uniref:Dirigent protein n=1 Tax=Oryza meridionalis TaxID=40149 RepID=A0A0E0EEY3_9ORYZ